MKRRCKHHVSLHPAPLVPERCPTGSPIPEGYRRRRIRYFVVKTPWVHSDIDQHHLQPHVQRMGVNQGEYIWMYIVL